MRSTERRWVLTAPEWTLRPQPPSFPSCSHFLLASQFVGRLSPVKPWLNWMFRRKWLVLNVCPAGLHFLDRPYAGDPGPNCHQACLRGRREQGCSRHHWWELRIAPPAQGKKRGLPKPPVLASPTWDAASRNCPLQPSSLVKRGSSHCCWLWLCQSNPLFSFVPPKLI